MGEVAYVVTSLVRRSIETALAMGFAVDDLVAMGSGYVPGEVDHHDQWAWEQPFVRYAELLRQGAGLAACTGEQLELWRAAARSVPDGGVGLVISHGGIIEPALVGALPEADHAAWGAPFAHLDGARLSFDAGHFETVQFRRAKLRPVTRW